MAKMSLKSKNYVVTISKSSAVAEWATVATVDMDRKLGVVALLAGSCDPI